MPHESQHSRLPHSEGSIFAHCAQAAARYNALNLAQGYPDFGPDARLMDALRRTAGAAHCHQYGPPEGLFALREAVAAMMEDLYGLAVDPMSEVTITVGATEAIFAAVQGLLKPGDEAVFFTPAFECYESAVRLAGAVPVPIPLGGETHLPDWSRVEERITPRTRLLIVNTPHNPSGVCWPLEDMRRLATLAERHDLQVLCDEVYHSTVFAPRHHVCAWSLPGLAQRSVVVGSLGKILHVTGWRLGYAIAPPRIGRELRKLRQFITYAAPTPLQQAVAAVLQDPGSYRGLAAFMQAKRDLFLDGLSGSRFKWIASEGGYFQLLDYSDISDQDDVGFAEHLIREYGVAGIPLSSFGVSPARSRLLRFCVAKRDDTLALAASLLKAVRPCFA